MDYLVDQEQAETPWRPEGQSVSISFFIWRSILIHLPSQPRIGNFCLFLIQISSALPCTGVGGNFFKDAALGIHHPVYITIRTWLLR